MLAAGVWKATAPVEWATRMNQALLPAPLSLPAAIGFGIAEIFCGVLLLIPRFRRWGAIVGGLLLLAFMGYFAIFYDRLVGDDCSCFPWIKRTVGPGFFISDAAMLLLAVLAGWWARPSRGIKTAAAILVVICVFAGVSAAVDLQQPKGKMAPAEITVNGAPYDLHEGRVLLYFFDPECTHCLFAAQEMVEYDWQDVQIIGIPTDRPQFADQFLEAAGMEAPLSSDVEKLRETYSFGDPPFAVALERGETIREMTVFEGEEPKTTLTAIGFVN